VGDSLRVIDDRLGQGAPFEYEYEYEYRSAEYDDHRRGLVHFSADKIDLADTRRPKTWT